jgi:hypothetical protein
VLSKLKNNLSKESQANSKQVEPREASGGDAALEGEIRRRAYEIYLERGEQPGSELDDWFQAKHELERLAVEQGS